MFPNGFTFIPGKVYKFTGRPASNGTGPGGRMYKPDDVFRCIAVFKPPGLDSHWNICLQEVSSGFFYTGSFQPHVSPTWELAIATKEETVWFVVGKNFNLVSVNFDSYADALKYSGAIRPDDDNPSKYVWSMKGKRPKLHEEMTDEEKQTYS